MIDRVSWICLGMALGFLLSAYMAVDMIRMPLSGPESRGDAIAAETKGE